MYNVPLLRCSSEARCVAIKVEDAWRTKSLSAFGCQFHHGHGPQVPLRLPALQVTGLDNLLQPMAYFCRPNNAWIDMLDQFALLDLPVA